MNKKMLSLLALSAAVLTSAPAYAATTQAAAASTVKSSAVADKLSIDEVKDRALKGLTDSKLNGPTYYETNESHQSKDGKEKVNYLVKHYRTSKLDKQTFQPDGTVTNSYVVSNVSVYYDESKYNSKSDAGIDTTAYSTIYVDDVYDSRGAKYWDMVAVEGGWRIDNNIVLKSMRIDYGQNGFGLSGYAMSQSSSYYPSSLTWSFNPPSSWTAVAATSSGTYTASAVGATSNCEIYRNGVDIGKLTMTNNM